MGSQGWRSQFEVVSQSCVQRIGAASGIAAAEFSHETIARCDVGVGGSGSGVKALADAADQRGALMGEAAALFCSTISGAAGGTRTSDTRRARDGSGAWGGSGDLREAERATSAFMNLECAEISGGCWAGGAMANAWEEWTGLMSSK